MCEKFHYDRLRNDRALGNRKFDNNNPKKKKQKMMVKNDDDDVVSAWWPVSGYKSDAIAIIILSVERLDSVIKWP